MKHEKGWCWTTKSRQSPNIELYYLTTTGNFCPSGGNQVVKALMRGSKTLAAVSAILVILAALLACRE